MIVEKIMRPIYTIEEDKTFFDCLVEMQKHKINNLLVINQEGKLVGMVNSNQIIHTVIPNYLKNNCIAASFVSEDIFIEDVKKVKDLVIKNFMISDLLTINSEDNIAEVSVLSLKNKKQLRLPVVNKEGEPIGIVTKTELRRFIASVLGIGQFGK